MNEEIDQAQDTPAAETTDKITYPENSTAADLQKAFAEARQQQSEIELLAPKHWAERDKQIFGKLDGRTKQWLLQRHKEMEGNYTKKTMELSEERKRYSEFTSVFTPYREELQRRGLSEVQAAAELLRLYQEQGLGRGVSNADAAKPPTHEVENLKKSFGELQQVFQQQQRQQQQLAIRIGQQKIKDLIDSKDETGQSKHKHFDKLLPTILMLAHADLLQGREPQLGDLYERAKWTDAEIRQAELAAQLDAAEKQRAASRRDKRQAAGNAGSSIYGKSAPGHATNRPARTLREELEAAFRESAQG
jgi:hypothetical protein